MKEIKKSCYRLKNIILFDNFLKDYYPGNPKISQAQMNKLDEKLLKCGLYLIGGINVKDPGILPLGKSSQYTQFIHHKSGSSIVLYGEPNYLVFIIGEEENRIKTKKSVENLIGDLKELK